MNRMDANVVEWNEPISYKKIREVRPGSYGILQVLTIDYKKRGSIRDLYIRSDYHLFLT